MTRHVQMQGRAGIGVGSTHRLVEFDTKAWLSRWNDVTLFPTDSLAQNLGMEAAPALDAFLNEEVRATGRELDRKSTRLNSSH